MDKRTFKHSKECDEAKGKLSLARENHRRMLLHGEFLTSLYETLIKAVNEASLAHKNYCEDRRGHH